MNAPKVGPDEYIQFTLATPRAYSAAEAAKVQPRQPDPPALDDSTLDKPHATAIELVTRHWSGKHKAVVRGTNLVTLLWTDGDRHVPCDYRLYDKANRLTKNGHFADMLRAAYARKFAPACVAFDGWYSSLDGLKLVRCCGLHWLTQLKSNRRVNPGRPEDELLPRARWSGCRGSARFGCSGSRPQTAAPTTGRRATWA